LQWIVGAVPPLYVTGIAIVEGLERGLKGSLPFAGDILPGWTPASQDEEILK
jgi:hypothetical protein